MCLATVYIEDDDGQREQVMQDVAWIKPEDGGLQLIPLFGESRLLQAQIESIDLMNSLIVLKRMTTNSAKGVSADHRDEPA
jgi:predicted RNA-binding protein